MEKKIVDESYLPRIAEQTLARKLASSGCVLISGPKFCGKSRLASWYAASSVELTDEGSIALAKADPRALLPGDSPRLIDEWQKVPVIWDLIRSDLDHGYRFGKYILTGSATPSDPSVIQHSGAGRISTMVLRPLSLYESRESLGAVSLSSLFAVNPEFTIVPPGENPMTLSRMAFLICRGGWPLSVLADESAALDVTEGYYEGLFRQTAGGDETSARLANGGRGRLLLVLKELARNISTPASIAGMARDIAASGEFPGFAPDTFIGWKEYLESYFIVFDMPSWNRNLRSSVVTRTSPVRHFFDPSIAACALGLTPESLLLDLRTFGFFFEDLVARDLMAFAESMKASVRHYRDSSDLEVDFILEMRDGRYAAIEAKLGSPEGVAMGVSSLSRFAARLQRAGQPLPAFRMVVTSHGACYREKDGTYVVPLNCLRP